RLPLLVQERPVVGADLRHPRLAEVLLGHDVHRHRGPLGRRGDAFLAEDRGAVRVADLRGPLSELDAGVRTLAFRSETTGGSHACLLFWTLPRAVSGPTILCRRGPAGRSPSTRKSCSGLRFASRGSPRDQLSVRHNILWVSHSSQPLFGARRLWTVSAVRCRA